MSNRRWAAVAAAGVLCCTALLTVALVAPASVRVPVDDWARLVAPVAGAASCLFAGRRQPGRARIAWLLVGAAALTWACGQAIWTYRELVLGQTPLPSLADAGFVTAVPVLLAALFVFPVWPAGRLAKVRAVSDGLLVAGCLLLVTWSSVLGAVAARPAGSAVAQWLSLAHPIGDIVVVAVLAIMWSRAAAGTRAPVLVLVAGLAVIAVSDSILSGLQARHSQASGSAIGVGLVVGYLLVGLAALVSLHRPLPATRVPARAWRLSLLPYAPVPVVVATVAQQRLHDGVISLFTLSMALAVLMIVLVRQGLAAQDNVGLLRRLASNETELRHRAQHDPLTDLLNRASFIRLADEQLPHRMPARLSAVLFIDLDDFKQINDSLGHSFGDQAIVGVGRRLLSCVRDGDLVARFGGDEFAIFLRDLPNVGLLVSVSERIIEALNEPFESSDMCASVCGTIGVAIAEASDGAGELLRRADIAMYAAKARGKGLFGIFEPSMHVAMYAPLERRADLERAVDAGEFELYFQPVVDVPTADLVGVEALIRWNHPRRGLLAPADFVDDVEKGGLMIQVGAWVIQEACRQVMRLRAASGLDVFASVNVTSSQMQDEDFIGTVADALAQTGLPPTALVVELVESGSIGESEVVAARLRVLRAMGARVAIDDFGTGYSSFMYLRRLRVDILKIEKCFIDDLVGDGPGTALVEGMIRLGGSLGLLTIGEGVEDETQQAALVRLGCSMAQGYLHSRPVRMEQLLLRHAERPLRTEDIAASG